MALDSSSTGIVVLTYRGAEVVRPLLEALDRTDAQVVVVDNASNDHIEDTVAEVLPGATLLRRSGNGGYGVAVNEAALALVAAGCDSLVFLTQDVKLEPACLGRLLAALERDTTLGAVGPLLGLSSEPLTVWSAGGTLGLLTCGHRGGGARVHDWVSPVTDHVAWLDGAVLAARSSAFLEVGGFRTDLFLYWEDVDFGLRLRQAGWEVGCRRDAIAWQEPGGMPDYLDARNAVRVLRGRGALHVVRRTARDARRHTLSFDRCRDRWRGLVDGLRSERSP